MPVFVSPRCRIKQRFSRRAASYSSFGFSGKCLLNSPAMIFGIWLVTRTDMIPELIYPALSVLTMSSNL